MKISIYRDKSVNNIFAICKFEKEFALTLRNYAQNASNVLPVDIIINYNTISPYQFMVFYLEDHEISVITYFWPFSISYEQKCCDYDLLSYSENELTKFFNWIINFRNLYLI